MVILTNSEDPYKMLHNVVFHQDLHCLLRQYSDNEIIHVTCGTQVIHTMYNILEICAVQGGGGIPGPV